MGFLLWQERRGKRKGAQPAKPAVHRGRRRSRILFMERMKDLLEGEPKTVEHANTYEKPVNGAEQVTLLLQENRAIYDSEYSERRENSGTISTPPGLVEKREGQQGGPCSEPKEETGDAAGVKSNQTSPDVNYSAVLGPACPAGWIVYGGKCYFFSEEKRNWASAQRFCISQGSSLAKIQSELEKVFMFRFKGEADHWIGLRKDFNDTWIWADGSEYSNRFMLKRSKKCTYLSKEFAIASRCHIPKKWICNHPDEYMRNKNSTAGKIR